MESEKNSEIASSIFSGLFWKFGERILAQTVSFVVSIVLARLLLPEDYGSVAIMMTFITFADVLVSSGFSTSLIQKKTATELDFSSIFYCSLFVSIILYIILFFISPLISNFYNMPILTLAIRVFSLRIPLGAYNSIQHAYVSRNMLFKKFFFSTLFGTITSAIIGIVLAFNGAGLWALIAQYMTNSIIDSIVLNFTIHWRPKLIFSWKSSKELMRYGWKILLADFSGTFFDELKGLVIGKSYSAADLAFFNRGRSLVNVVTDNIRTSIMSVLFPAMSNEVDDKKRIKKMTRLSVEVMAYIIFPATIGFVLVARPLIDCLLTEKWEPSVFFLQISAITAAIEMVGHVTLQCIKATGRSDIVLINDIINKPFFIIVLLLSNTFGIKTFCMLLVLSSIIGTIINIIGCKKCINYTLPEVAYDLASPFFMSIAMGISIIPIMSIPMPNMAKLCLEIIISILIYFLLSIWIKPKPYKYLKNIVAQKFAKKQLFHRKK